jgi:hypothetical protein
VIHTRFEPYEREGFVWAHGVLCDLDDEGDVLVSGQAWHQIVELEHEADVPSAIGRKGAIIELSQVHVLEEQVAACCVVEAFAGKQRFHWMGPRVVQVFPASETRALLAASKIATTMWCS